MNARHPSKPRAVTLGSNAAIDNSATDPPQVSLSPSDTSGVGVTAGFADPCALLTQDEVDTAVGQPLQPGNQVATLDDCQWTNSDFTASVDVTVTGGCSRL